MAVKRSRIVTGSLLAGIILTPFIFLSSPLHPWRTSNIGVTLLQDLTYPVENLWHHAIDGVRHTWMRYVSLIDAERDNEKLRAENARLRLGQTRYQELDLELASLRRQVGLTAHMTERFQMAEVIGRAGSRPFRSLRIARGSGDGLKPGFPALTADGAIGRVLRVGLHHADVQIIVDSDFSLDVLLQRNRVRGVLHGSGDDRCRLQLHRQAEARIGDSVITSGIVGSFPKGIPVGRVVGISYETDNVTQVITVEPWVDFNRLEDVVILERPDIYVERIGATGGPAWIDEAIGRDPGTQTQEGD